MVGAKSRRILKSVALVIAAAAALFLVFFFVIIPFFLIEGHSPEYGMETTYSAVTVEGPSREDFSSDEAWADYQENWQDPSWDGEYPEGWRCKVARRTVYFGGSEHEEAWVAGLLALAWPDGADISKEDARTIAGLTGANGWLLIDSEAYRKTEHSLLWLLLFCNEDTDLPRLSEDQALWSNVVSKLSEEERPSIEVLLGSSRESRSAAFEMYMEMTQDQ